MSLYAKNHYNIVNNQPPTNKINEKIKEKLKTKQNKT